MTERIRENMKAALCQLESSDNVSANLRRITETMEKYRADLYVFPEMFLTRYGNRENTDADASAAAAVLEDLCRERNAAVAVGGAGPGNTNSLYFISPAHTCRYDKLYPAKFEPYNEEYTPGNVPVVGKHGGETFGLEICYDVMFPEIHRHYAKSGTDIIIVISASCESSRNAMRTILPARSLENTVYTLYCNNTGTGPSGTYFGGSAAYSPTGGLIAEAGPSECVTLVELSREEIIKARCARHHLEDLRDDVPL